MDLHIDDFYKDAAKGLLMLYQAFPKKTTLYMDDLIGYIPPDEFGLPSDRQQRSTLDDAPPSIRRPQGSLANQLREALQGQYSERVIELMQLFFQRPVPHN